MILLWPHVEGTNEISKTQDSVKDTGPSIYFGKKTNEKE